MTTKLEMHSYNADRLAEIFESSIPFNKLLGLRCLEIEDGRVAGEDQPRPYVHHERRFAPCPAHVGWAWAHLQYRGLGSLRFS
jgi:uncharacterized membrane-anchored protein